MKQILSLLKVQFKQSYRKGKGANRSKKGSVGMVVAYILCIAVLSPYLFASLYFLSQYAINVGKAREYIAILLFIIQGFALIFGTMALVNIMFLSKDNEILLALPIPQRRVFAAKFLYVLLHELLLGIVIGFTGIGIFGYLSGGGVAFYLLGGIAVVVAPILALAISSVLLLPIILVCAHLRKTPVLSGLISIAIFCGGMYLYMNFIFGLSSGSEDMGNVAVLLFEVIAQKLVFNLIVADVVLLLPNFATSLGVSIAMYVGLFAIACALTSMVYKKASTLTTEKTSGGKIKTSNAKRGVLKALIIRDLKCISRIPMLLMTCVSQMILAPITLSIMSSMYRGDMQDLQLGIMFMMGSMFVGGMNQFASSSFTRENEAINILKTIPVPTETIVTSKFIIAIASAAVTNVLVLAALIASGMNMTIAFMLFLYFAMLSLGMIAWQIKSDLDSPKLGWVNINEGLKKNKAATISVFSTMGIGTVGMFAFTIVGMMKPNLTLIILAFLTTLCAIFAILQLRSLYKNAGRLFGKIEF